jgi:pilus assembly protein Flp/PilA
MNSVMVSMVAFVAGIKNRLTGEEKGATMVEYGLMVALIAVVVAVAAGVLGTGIAQLFTDVDASL